MITKFLNALKQSGKLSLLFALIFIVGILISAYHLFTLPHNLILKGGLPTLELAWPLLIRLFIVIGLTFIAGIAAVNIALQSRQSIVVYVDRKKEDSTSAAQREEGSGGLSDLTSFRATLQQAKGETEVLQEGLNALCQQLQAGQGAIYRLANRDGKRIVELTHGFALPVGESSNLHYEWGEGMIGQAAATGKSVYVDEVPEGYITIVSGLGTASPRYLMIVPFKKGEDVKGVLELATFAPIPDGHRARVEELVQVLGERIN
jgi:methyl-accepting chemotaxis protein